MFILDRLVIGGLTFVLDKLAVSVDRELNDDSALRERLLVAQMQVELGELDEQGFREVERDVVRRLRELREQRGTDRADMQKFRGVSVEATFGDDE